MSNVKDQIAIIIEELGRLQTVPPPYRDEDDDFPLPRLIGTGNGNSILVSRKIDVAIAIVADQLRSETPSLATKTTRDEWRGQVRRAFGPALAGIDLAQDLRSNVDSVIFSVKMEVQKSLTLYIDREFIFGCTLFYDKSLPPFQIGPVCFEPRSAWLIRQRQEGRISAVGYRRIEEKWRGKNIRKRTPSSDSLLETNILEAIGKCPYVCNVKTFGLGAEAGREKALTVSRLALASIALLWRSSAKAIDGMNLLPDRPPHIQTILSTVHSQLILSSSKRSHMPHGPNLDDGQWEDLLFEYKNHFEIVGEILSYLINPHDETSRPKLKNTLAHALLWFHEGCREPAALFAIVKYSAAMDALACGRGANGIKRLINNRIGIEGNTQISPNGPTLSQAIDEIYGYGRSRTIHGGNDRLRHDWTATKELAEQLARICLLTCLDWAASNPTADDPKQLSQSLA